jgi:hypothetical protein
MTIVSGPFGGGQVDDGLVVNSGTNGLLEIELRRRK